MLVHTCIFLFMVVNGDQISCCVWNNESASFVRRIYSVFMSKTLSFMSKPCQFFFFEIKEKYFQTLNVVCIRPISAWKSSAAASMIKELL